ncbi:MAG: DUF1223 domain-containing protein [Gallionellaceae bacterium]|nr:DUF1223 domain-containing protein [Gallionellaceae bacterium]
MTNRSLLYFALLLMLAGPARADCSAGTGPARNALLELYTSEGCSSCPPAERWLSGLRDQGGGAKRRVPLAFHVDYWNQLGWVDRYARAEYSARQRWLAGVSGARTVYTPQFMLDGRDWPSWRSGLPEARDDRAAGAEIRLELGPIEDGRLAVGGEAGLRLRRDGARLFLALYENNLSSRIEAGENAGRVLRHDFVVRRLLGPIRLADSGSMPIRQVFDLDAGWKRTDLGVAAFIQDIGTGEVYQALGVSACGGPARPGSR